PVQSGDRRAQALEDLRALVEAIRVLDGVPPPHTVEHQRMLARLYSDSAAIHRSLGNEPGAVHDLKRSAELLNEIVTAGPNHQFSRHMLVVVLNSLALALRAQGATAQALTPSH